MDKNIYQDVAPIVLYLERAIEDEQYRTEAAEHDAYMDRAFAVADATYR